MLPYGKTRLNTLMFRGNQFYFGFKNMHYCTEQGPQNRYWRKETSNDKIQNRKL